MGRATISARREVAMLSTARTLAGGRGPFPDAARKLAARAAGGKPVLASGGCGGCDRSEAVRRVQILAAAQHEDELFDTAEGDHHGGEADPAFRPAEGEQRPEGE